MADWKNVALVDNKPKAVAATDKELLDAPPAASSDATVLPFRSQRAIRRSHSPRPFEETLQAARGGSDDAFTQLYRAIAPRIESYARARGAPHPDDLVNDVLLKIFTRLQQFEGNEAQFNAWVFRTVRNTLIDQARKLAVRPVETLVELTPDTESHDDPARVAVGNDELQSILKHLDVLTAEQRDVVLLRVLGDLTINSVAEILHKTPGATKAIQRRAFTTLAKALQGVDQARHEQPLA